MLFQTVRHKRVNLRKPRPPHFEAQKVQKALDVTIPKPHDVDFPSFLKCRKPLKNLLMNAIEVRVIHTNNATVDV